MTSSNLPTSILVSYQTFLKANLSLVKNTLGARLSSSASGSIDLHGNHKKKHF